MLLLYNPISTHPGKAPVPMSLLALGAVLEGKCPYEIVDGNVIADPQAFLLERLGRGDVKALGMTVMPGPQLNHAVPLTRTIKRAFPDLPIIWGGYFPTQHSQVVLDSGYVDYVVIGQGEMTLLDLLHVLEQGGNLHAIPGLAFRENGSIVTNPSRPLTPLDQFPGFPYHQVDMTRYIHSNYVGSRTIDHNASFGCPFACSFCAIVSMTNRRWLPEAAERTAATIRSLYEDYGVNAVQFHDMDFFISEKRVADFCRAILDLNITWWALGRIDELSAYSDETWALMKRSGLKMIFCGAESGSDETLQAMNKGGNASTKLTLELAARMKKYDIVPEYSFVLGNPPDPEKDTAITFEFIRKIKAINPATELILYTYTPVPMDAGGGDLFERATAAGFRFPERLDDWVEEPWRSFALRRDPKTPWLDGAMYRRIRDFERVMNAYYPTVTDLKLSGWRRALLRALSAPRYHLRIYRWPLELRLLQRLFRYQRPETTGF